MKTRKRKLQPSSLELDRQVQMRRLMSRYSRLITTPGALLYAHSWNIGYIDKSDPFEQQYQEFTCNTHNVVFAAMVFEGTKLLQGKTVSVFYIEYCNIVSTW